MNRHTTTVALVALACVLGTIGATNYDELMICTPDIGACNIDVTERCNITSEDSNEEKMSKFNNYHLSQPSLLERQLNAIAQRAGTENIGMPVTILPMNFLIIYVANSPTNITVIAPQIPTLTFTYNTATASWELPHNNDASAADPIDYDRLMLCRLDTGSCDINIAQRANINNGDSKAEMKRKSAEFFETKRQEYYDEVYNLISHRTPGAVMAVRLQPLNIWVQYKTYNQTTVGVTTPGARELMYTFNNDDNHWQIAPVSTQSQPGGRQRRVAGYCYRHGCRYTQCYDDWYDCPWYYYLRWYTMYFNNCYIMHWRFRSSNVYAAPLPGTTPATTCHPTTTTEPGAPVRVTGRGIGFGRH